MKRNAEVRSYNDLFTEFMSGKIVPPPSQGQAIPLRIATPPSQAQTIPQNMENGETASSSTEYNEQDENCILEQMAEHSDVAISRLENFWRVNHKLKGTAIRPRNLFAFLNHTQDILTYSRFYEHISPECIWLRQFDIHMNHRTKYVHPQGYIMAVAMNIVPLDDLVKEFEVFARKCLESMGLFCKRRYGYLSPQHNS